MKKHKVSEKEFKEAEDFEKTNGFWNSAQTPLETVCAMTDPLWITCLWERTNCKKCLKSMPKETGE